MRIILSEVDNKLLIQTPDGNITIEADVEKTIINFPNKNGVLVESKNKEVYCVTLYRKY